MTTFYPVLLIDDLRNFRELQEAVVVRNSKEALDFLSENADAHFGSVWFDHDLGIVDGQKDTTMKVVDYFSERAFNDDPVNVDVVYVHTSNNVGHKQIVMSLSRYGYNVRSVYAGDHFIVEE